jgi:ribosomal protein L32
MEAYKTVCSNCGHVRFWVGYKTGIGKTLEQIQKMERDHSVCKKCGSGNIKTELDYQSETGKKFATDAVSCAEEILRES